MKSVILCVVVLTGCSANRRIVTEFSTQATYHVATYENRCQKTDGHFPPECLPCQAIINEAVWQAKVAEINKKQGYLPPKEIQDIERLIKELDRCP